MKNAGMNWDDTDTHLRKLLRSYVDEPYRFSAAHQKTDDFKAWVNFLLSDIVEAAIDDDCSREWLVERLLVMAEVALKTKQRMSPELERSIQDMIIRKTVEIHGPKKKAA